MTTFAPSQVNVTQIFVGTFDHVEAENTAAVIVKVLAMNGDTWRTATCEELAAGFTKLTDAPGLWRARFNNPFMRIDMHDLVDRGFAEWDGEKAIKFTDKGLRRMEKWCFPPALPEFADLAEFEIRKYADGVIDEHLPHIVLVDRDKPLRAGPRDRAIGCKCAGPFYPIRDNRGANITSPFPGYTPSVCLCMGVFVGEGNSGVAKGCG